MSLLSDIPNTDTRPCSKCEDNLSSRKLCLLCDTIYCYSTPIQFCCYGNHDCIGYDDNGNPVLG
jgi:hypothetical protein